MNVHTLQYRQAETVEFSTDAPQHAEDLAAAFAEFLSVTAGDRVAAAILAVGAVLAVESIGNHKGGHAS